jgi:cullin 3
VVRVGHGGEALYTQVATTMAAEVEKLAGSLDSTASAPDDHFLQELLSRWKTHSNAVEMISDVVIYMDRTFVLQRHKAPVSELGLRAWRDGMLRPDGGEVRSRLQSALLEMVGRERAGETVDVPLRNLMAGATKMLVEVGDGLYEEVLEAPFLDEVRRLCAGESVRLLASPCGCGEYLRTVESMMDAEKARVSRFLDAGTEDKVAVVVLTEMVETNVARLVGMEGSGLASMLVDGRYWDLTRMHRLLGRVQGGVPAMRDCMNAHFQEIRNTAADDERLLSREKERYREMINGVFRGEVSFHADLDSCFT